MAAAGHRTLSRICAGIGALLAGVALSAAAAAAAASDTVDLELVIATDTSRSIDEEEATLQREGVIAAFRAPEVVRAIQAGNLGRVGVAYLDWSVDYMNKIVVDWTVINNKASADAFADALQQAPLNPGQRTSISGALQMATQMLETNRLQGARRVIDVSGDGPNNYGLELAPVREETLAKGIAINGLPIIVENAPYAGNGYVPDIDKYYASCVIGGRGAFLIVARGFQDFATAIRHKLVLEISSLSPPVKYAGSGLIRAAARPQQIQLPTAGKPPVIVRPPAVREQNCDRNGFGFGGGGGGFGPGTFGR
jgi:hypothetical protein